MDMVAANLVGRKSRVYSRHPCGFRGSKYTNSRTNSGAPAENHGIVDAAYQNIALSKQKIAKIGPNAQKSGKISQTYGVSTPFFLGFWP